MKHITAIATAVYLLAALALGGTVSAQDHVARVTVPFDFNVGNKWLPAGAYTLSSDSYEPNVISIRSRDDNKISLLSIVESDGQRLKEAKLVFTKYGDQYFLHEILCSSCGMNVAFPDSKHEKTARLRMEAGLSNPSDVYLALNNR